MSHRLRGIFLTAANPGATARFYQEVADVELEEVGSHESYVYWKVDSDGLQLAIHDAARFAKYTDPPNPESNLTHLYFQIESQEFFLERLKRFDITPYATDEVVVTVKDPDGRMVMFGTA